MSLSDVDEDWFAKARHVELSYSIYLAYSFQVMRNFIAWQVINRHQPENASRDLTWRWRMKESSITLVFTWGFIATLRKREENSSEESKRDGLNRRSSRLACKNCELHLWIWFQLRAYRSWARKPEVLRKGGHRQSLIQNLLLQRIHCYARGHPQWGSSWYIAV